MFPWETLITGAVGLAGIGGTLWQGKRSREAQTADLKASLDATAENLKAGIKAENERARLAEKRLIYADCLTAFVEMMPATAGYRVEFSAADHDAEKLQAAESRLGKARDAMYRALSLVEVGGSDEVAKLAQESTDAFMKYVFATRTGESSDADADKIRDAMANLRQAMRADLGETD
jgi:hypothetical protein